MGDFLDILAADAKKTVSKGYYQVDHKTRHSGLSLKDTIEKCQTNAVISEIKKTSPSLGLIRTDINPAEMALEMVNGGATGISVLTEPIHFNGELNSIRKVRGAVQVPILMKDIIIDTEQIEAASSTQADVILLIKALFERGHSAYGLDEMISLAHEKGLEVLLETHTEKEFRRALQSDADMIGINNRNLKTLEVDLGVTERILESIHPEDKIIVSESGVKTPQDLLRLKETGARAFLIGSALMQTRDIRETVKRFVKA
ncbi:indole-3-glycerol phosphate synthase [Candidatus Bathyarchaeota archaeon]|jgi:indole-3-glycerol phosphate synthase|nr:indole-3-glycerol phosphate synthase [Candidatus Bathyarchaeota archaeon]MDP6048270.1 indole-3-glycerol-phosphate synthase [Candidatus Bathyarchaeota archaeon]MDP7443174.1 indole-3-glycerol-phosphate synthase [Candidatus Bathyarchaeota archaeon]|tara:strand:- start:3169 stop:3945 length:777 start_codon:yes stop_codon:yes gene_type:complete